jgi:hypothetical protein
MPRKRLDVWRLGNALHDTILCCARAVKAPSSRRFKDITSWGYLAAKHRDAVE